MNRLDEEILKVLNDCGYYRSIGIDMTKKKYDEISKLIEEYCKFYNIE